MPRNVVLAIGVILFGILAFDMMGILVRAAAVVVAQFCFYTALTKIEFATAGVLGFSGPIFIAALSVSLLGHRVGIWRWGRSASALSGG